MHAREEKNHLQKSDRRRTYVTVRVCSGACCLAQGVNEGDEEKII